MFDDVLRYVENLEDSATTSTAFLRKLRGARTRLKNKIEKSREQVKLLRNPDRLVETILPEIEDAVFKNGKDILQGSILEALRENYEFDWPVYKRALIQVAKNRDIFKMYSLGGTGWNKKFIFLIDLNSSAGRIQDWARGVKAYRRILEQEKEQKRQKAAKKKGKEVRRKRYNPLSASRAWAGIFGNREATSLFTQTVTRRLELSGKPAPFWLLLDKGEVPMSSDRGGYPTPKKRATNFLFNAETVTKEYMNNLLIAQRAKYEKFQEDYDKNIDQAEEVLESIESKIERLALDLNELKRLAAELDLDIRYIDSNKFDNAVQLIREGLLTKGTVELTARGGPRTRRSVSRIAQLLY